jgi:hypothetical protein
MVSGSIFPFSFISILIVKTNQINIENRYIFLGSKGFSLANWNSENKRKAK